MGSSPVGASVSSPIWGLVVDKRGPRIPLVLAFISLLMGYSGIKMLFDAGIPEGTTTISTTSLCLLVLCSWMAGSGGCGGATCAMNATAKSFPPKMVRFITVYEIWQRIESVF